MFSILVRPLNIWLRASRDANASREVMPRGGHDRRRRLFWERDPEGRLIGIWKSE